MRIEIVDTQSLSPEENAAAWAWMRAAFNVIIDDYVWAEPDYRLRLWDDERWIGHIDIDLRHARVGDQPVWLGGVGGVVVLPEYRNRGLASLMLEHAHQFLFDTPQVDFGLLMCHPHLQPFYGRVGWRTVASGMHILQPQGSMWMDATVMILPVRQSAWPEGEIDLCGPPW
jgi:GNAT superfamily N-acetyltransferase